MEDEKLLCRLKENIGKPMKYKELCAAIGLPEKTSNSKTAQINNLQMYCRFDIINNPTRYVIREVYDEELKHLGLTNGNNKFQSEFDLALFRALASNNGEDLYLSDSDTLRLFGEVNENFSYACNADYMNLLGDEYSYMPEMGLTIAKILKQWTKRRLSSMESRKLFIRRAGFRVYKELQSGAILTANVPEKSDLEKLCQEIYYETAEAIMPPDWGDNKRGKYWVKQSLWFAFERKIKELILKKTNGEYTDMKCISIISPASKQFLDRLAAEEELKLHGINDEVQRKILATKTLSCFKPYKRQKFIEINIRPNPKISLKKIVKELDK